MKNYNKIGLGEIDFAKEVKKYEEQVSAANTVNNTNTTEVKTMTTTQTLSAQTFASKGITVNFDNGTLNNRVVRNYAIIREITQKGKIKSETLVKRNQLINLVAKSLVGKNASQAKSLVFQVLEQALFVEEKGYGNPEAATELPLDIDVANANRAYVLLNGKNGLTAVNLDSKTVARLMEQNLGCGCAHLVDYAEHGLGAAASPRSALRPGCHCPCR